MLTRQEYTMFQIPFKNSGISTGYGKKKKAIPTWREKNAGNFQR